MPQNDLGLLILSLSSRRRVSPKKHMFERVVRMQEGCKLNCRILSLALATANKFIIKNFK